MMGVCSLKKCIVYVSQTGHTKAIVKRFNGFKIFELKEKDNQVKTPEYIDISSYDQIIFACPVHGFRAAAPMVDFLKQLNDLDHKVIDIFVTHLFRFSFLGGNQALKMMSKMIESKNGKIRYLTSINRRSKKSNDAMIELVKKYSK